MVEQGFNEVPKQGSFFVCTTFALIAGGSDMADWMLVGGYTNTVCSFHAGSNHRLSGAFPRVQRYNIIKVYQLCLWCTFFFLPFLPSPPPKKKTWTYSDAGGYYRLQRFSWVSIFSRPSPPRPLLRKTKRETKLQPSNLTNTSRYHTPHLPRLSTAFSVIPLNERLLSAQSPLPLYLFPLLFLLAVLPV